MPELSQPLLAAHGSKLHLIDESTLTSLPFAPPPPKRVRRQDLALFGSSAKRPAISDVLSDDDCDDTMDGTLDETHEIVLVEDYLPPTGPPTRLVMLRQQSLASIKKRVRSAHWKSASSLCSPAHIAEPPKEDLEAIFGKLPGTDMLRHCTLCDKPLYEVLSLILSESPACHELVCSACINTYESILDELHDAEAQLHADGDSVAEMLLETLGHLSRGPSNRTLAQDSTHTPAQGLDVLRRGKRTFSSELIGRLHELSNMAQPRAHTPRWLAELLHRIQLLLRVLVPVSSRRLLPEVLSH